MFVPFIVQGTTSKALFHQFYWLSVLTLSYLISMVIINRWQVAGIKPRTSRSSTDRNVNNLLMTSSPRVTLMHRVTWLDPLNSDSLERDVFNFINGCWQKQNLRQKFVYFLVYKMDLNVIIAFHSCYAFSILKCQKIFALFPIGNALH